MLVLKRFSAELLSGVSYIDATVNRIDDNTPIIGKPTKRIRKKINKLVKPTLKLIEVNQE